MEAQASFGIASVETSQELWHLVSNVKPFRGGPTSQHAEHHSPKLNAVYPGSVEWLAPRGAKSVPGNLAETMERVRKVRSGAQAEWRHARSAFQEAQKMHEKLDHQVAQLANDPPLQGSHVEEATCRGSLGRAFGEGFSVWTKHRPDGDGCA